MLEPNQAAKTPWTARTWPLVRLPAVHAAAWGAPPSPMILAANCIVIPSSEAPKTIRPSEGNCLDQRYPPSSRISPRPSSFGFRAHRSSFPDFTTVQITPFPSAIVDFQVSTARGPYCPCVDWNCAVRGQEKPKIARACVTLSHI